MGSRVRVEDLNHDELLELDSAGGVIRFAGQRALLLDAVAMGLLRHHLVENFGVTAARAVLTQFGFAHGWRMAAAMKKEFNWAGRPVLFPLAPMSPPLFMLSVLPTGRLSLSEE